MTFYFKLRLIVLILLTVFVSGCGVTNSVEAHKRHLYSSLNYSFGQLQNNPLVQKYRDIQKQAAIKEQVRNGEIEVPVDLAKKVIKNTFDSNICNGGINLKITISEVLEDKNNKRFLRVYGTLHANDERGKVLETHLKGNFDRSNGFMSIHASKPPTLKDIVEYDYGKGNVGKIAYEGIRKDWWMLRKFEKSFNPNAFPNLTDESIIESLYIDVARDTEGKGWVGSFEANGFESCRDIRMVGSRGATTDYLPTVTDRLVLQRGNVIQAFSAASTNLGRIYWMLIAEKRKLPEVNYYLGLAYEEQGVKAPENYHLAIQYYRKQADYYNDARAQEALGRIYAEGLGAERNATKSRYWIERADAQKLAAGKICTNQKVLDKASQLIKSEIQDPVGKQVQLLGLMAGIATHVGIPLVQSITLKNVVSIDSKFECAMEVQLSEFVMQSITPDFECGSVDEYGNLQCRNMHYEQQLRDVMAEAGTELSKKPYVRTILIVPQGGGAVKMTLKSAGIKLSREYSDVVELY